MPEKRPKDQRFDWPVILMIVGLVALLAVAFWKGGGILMSISPCGVRSRGLAPESRGKVGI